MRTQVHLHNVMNIDRTKHTHVTSLILRYYWYTRVLPESSWTHENSKGSSLLLLLEALTEIFEKSNI